MEEMIAVQDARARYTMPINLLKNGILTALKTLSKTRKHWDTTVPDIRTCPSVKQLPS